MKHNSKSTPARATTPSRSSRPTPAASATRSVAFWKRHHEDTMAVIHGRIKPEMFKNRYGYLPRLVQRALDRGDRRFTRRSR